VRSALAAAALLAACADGTGAELDLSGEWNLNSGVLRVNADAGSLVGLAVGDVRLTLTHGSLGLSGHTAEGRLVSTIPQAYFIDSDLVGVVANGEVRGDSIFFDVVFAEYPPHRFRGRATNELLRGTVTILADGSPRGGEFWATRR